MLDNLLGHVSVISIVLIGFLIFNGKFIISLNLIGTVMEKEEEYTVHPIIDITRAFILSPLCHLNSCSENICEVSVE